MPDRRAFLPEDFLRLKTIGDAQIAPDGSRVAYTLSWVEGDKDAYRTQIYIVGTSGDTPLRWTNGPKSDSQPRWSPDGRYLAFLRELPEQKPQLYVIRAGGGEAWPLTNLPKGVESHTWGPDSRRIAFVAATGGEPPQPKEQSTLEKHQPRVFEHLNYKLDGVGYFDGGAAHIFVIALDETDPVRLQEPRQITDGDWHDRFPCWSPDGREIAFASYREPDRHEVMWIANDIWVVSSDGGEPRKLTTSTGPANLPIWSPDGTSIAYLGHAHGNQSLGRTTHVRVISATGGESATITAGLDRTVIGPPFFSSNVLAWSADSRGLFFIAMDRGNMPIYYADLHGNVEVVAGGERQATGLSLASTGTQIGFTAFNPGTPLDVYVLDRAGEEERRLTTSNRDLLDEIELGVTERMTWTGADGWEIEGWLLKPPGFQPGQPYPTILEIHGGPHGQYGNFFDPGFHAMAGAGYLVLYANPRGSTGYGEAFCQACVNDLGGKDFEDLMYGVEHTVEQGLADPRRLGVAGYSYGGFMTTWIVGHTQRFRAAVAGAPVSNAYSFWGTSDIGPQFGQVEFGDVLPHEAPEHYLQGSPVHHLRDCETPLLLLHHEGDLRCPIGQSEEVFAILKKLGKEAVLVRYPGGFHRYVSHAPSQRVDAMQRTNGWFGRFLTR